VSNIYFLTLIKLADISISVSRAPNKIHIYLSAMPYDNHSTSKWDLNNAMAATRAAELPPKGWVSFNKWLFSANIHLPLFYFLIYHVPSCLITQEVLRTAHKLHHPKKPCYVALNNEQGEKQ
jgi:hypothetical protein